MRRITTPFLAYFLTCSLTFASYIHLTLDSNTRDEPDTIVGTFSANTPMFKATLLDNAVGLNLAGTTSTVYFYYAQLPVTGGYARITGSYTTNLVTFTGTNDFPASGDYEWAVVRQWRQTATYTNVVTYGQGSMKVKRSGAAGATTVAVLRSTVNWNTVTMTGTPPWGNTSALTNSLTNVLIRVQSTTNWVAKIGRQVRVTFNTNYPSQTQMSQALTNVLTRTQGSSNWVYKSGRQIGTIFKTNYASVAQATNSVTNGLTVVQSTSNQFVRVGRQLRMTVRTNFVESVAGNWTGTFDGQEGSWYRNYANVTNKDAVVVTNETSPVSLGAALTLLTPASLTNHAVRWGQRFDATHHTGLVSSVVADAAKFLRGDGTWQTVSGSFTGVVSTAGGTSLVYNTTATNAALKGLISGANITITDNGTNVTITGAAGGGSGSQTPWTNIVNGAGYKLTNTHVRALSMYVAGGQTNAGAVTLLTQGATTNQAVRVGQMNATNTAWFDTAGVRSITGDVEFDQELVATILGDVGATNTLQLSCGVAGATANDSFIDIGKQTAGYAGAFANQTGVVVVVAQNNGTPSDIALIGDRIRYGQDGSAIQWSIDEGNIDGTGKTWSNAVLNKITITEVNYVVVTNYVRIPGGQFVRFWGAGWTNDFTFSITNMLNYNRQSTGIVTSQWYVK